MQQPAGSRNPVAGAIALVGGVVVVVGSLLPWVRFSIFRFSNTVYGTGSTDGKVVVALGIATVLAGVLMVAVPSLGARRALAVAALLFGLGTVYVTGKNILTKDQQTTEALRNLIEQRTGRTATPRELRILRRELRSFGFSLEFGSGIYVALTGGAVAAVGGLLGLVLVGDREPVPVAGPAGSGPSSAWTPAWQPPTGGPATAQDPAVAPGVAPGVVPGAVAPETVPLGPTVAPAPGSPPDVVAPEPPPPAPADEARLPSEEPSITASPGLSSAGSASVLPPTPAETDAEHPHGGQDVTPDWEAPPGPADRPGPP
jgi:hypothetical protein